MTVDGEWDGTGVGWDGMRDETTQEDTGEEESGAPSGTRLSK